MSYGLLTGLQSCPAQSQRSPKWKSWFFFATFAYFAALRETGLSLYGLVHTFLALREVARFRLSARLKLCENSSPRAELSSFILTPEAGTAPLPRPFAWLPNSNFSGTSI